MARQREDGTDEEEGDSPGDYIGDRLAHARLESTGQLYREVRAVNEQWLVGSVVDHVLRPFGVRWWL